MTAITRLHRFDAEGRHQGFIVVDRPIEEYAARIGVDLTLDYPPDAPIGYHARRQNDGWVLVQDGADVPTPTLDALKAAKWVAMKALRKKAIETALVTPHGTFDADPESRNNIIQTAHLMQTAAQSLAPESVPTVEFTLADNSVATLTAGEMVEVALLLAAQIQAAYARGRVVRAAIDAASSGAELDAVSWQP